MQTSILLCPNCSMGVLSCFIVSPNLYFCGTLLQIGRVLGNRYRINSQTLEDTQVGYILQKYTCPLYNTFFITFSASPSTQTVFV